MDPAFQPGLSADLRSPCRVPGRFTSSERGLRSRSGFCSESAEACGISMFSARVATRRPAALDRRLQGNSRAPIEATSNALHVRLGASSDGHRPGQSTRGGSPMGDARAFSRRTQPNPAARTRSPRSLGRLDEPGSESGEGTFLLPSRRVVDREASVLGTRDGMRRCRGGRDGKSARLCGMPHAPRRKNFYSAQPDRWHRRHSGEFVRPRCEWLRFWTRIVPPGGPALGSRLCRWQLSPLSACSAPPESPSSLRLAIASQVQRPLPRLRPFLLLLGGEWH